MKGSIPKVGYLLCGETLLLASRGILKVEELKDSDSVLWLDLERNKAVFRKINNYPINIGENISVRITTDVNEIIIPEQMKLYTISGKKKASQITKGDLLDVFNKPQTFDKLRNIYNSLKIQSINVGSRKIRITENFAYLLGTQIMIREWDNNKIVMYLESYDNLRKICKILKLALEENNFIYNFDFSIKYRLDKLKIILFDETPDRFIIYMVSKLFKPASIKHNYISPQVIPYPIRLSSTNIIKQFTEGFLDSCARISKGGLLRFYTFARDSEIRRFLFSVLALFNIQPRYTFVKSLQNTKIMYTYLALPKGIQLFNLKSLSTKSKEALVNRSRIDLKIYSEVKYIARFKRPIYFIPCPKENLDIIADLTPIHPQKFQKFYF